MTWKGQKQLFSRTKYFWIFCHVILENYRFSALAGSSIMIKHIPQRASAFEIFCFLGIILKVAAKTDDIVVYDILPRNWSSLMLGENVLFSYSPEM